jgi:hypothetical protein
MLDEDARDCRSIEQRRLVRNAVDLIEERTRNTSRQNRVSCFLGATSHSVYSLHHVPDQSKEHGKKIWNGGSAMPRAGSRKPDVVQFKGELSTVANGILEQFLKRTGMTKKEAMSRLVEWFAAQDYTAQSAITQQLHSADAPLAAALVLSRIDDASLAGVYERALAVAAVVKDVREIREAHQHRASKAE